MNDIVRKESNLPSLEMPQLPQIFSRLVPTQVPELTFNKGLIRGWFHEKKLARMERVSEHEAGIAKNRYEVTKYTADSLIEAATFGSRLQTALMRYEHEQFTMTHEKKMMELAEKKEEALTAQEVYKAKILEIDFKDAELTYNLKLKELGHDDQDEDRE